MGVCVDASVGVGVDVGVGCDVGIGVVFGDTTGNGDDVDVVYMVLTLTHMLVVMLVLMGAGVCASVDGDVSVDGSDGVCVSVGVDDDVGAVCGVCVLVVVVLRVLMPVACICDCVGVVVHGRVYCVVNDVDVCLVSAL